MTEGRCWLALKELELTGADTGGCAGEALPDEPGSLLTTAALRLLCAFCSQRCGGEAIRHDSDPRARY